MATPQRFPRMLRIGAVARLVGRSTATIRNYERQGIIKPTRLAAGPDPRGQRYYDTGAVLELARALGVRIPLAALPQAPHPARHVIVLGRPGAWTRAVLAGVEAAVKVAHGGPRVVHASDAVGVYVRIAALGAARIVLVDLYALDAPLGLFIGTVSRLNRPWPPPHVIVARSTFVQPNPERPIRVSFLRGVADAARASAAIRAALAAPEVEPEVDGDGPDPVNRA